MAILHQLLIMGALIPSTAVTIPHPNRVTHHQPNNTRESSSPAINDKMGISDLSAVTVLKVVIQDILRHLLNLPMATVSLQSHNMVDQAINRYATLELTRVLEELSKPFHRPHHQPVMGLAHRLAGDLPTGDDPVSLPIYYDRSLLG